MRTLLTFSLVLALAAPPEDHLTSKAAAAARIRCRDGDAGQRLPVSIRDVSDHPDSSRHRDHDAAFAFPAGQPQRRCPRGRKRLFLSFELLIRIGREYELTPLATELLDPLRNILKEIDKVTADVLLARVIRLALAVQIAAQCSGLLVVVLMLHVAAADLVELDEILRVTKEAR